MTIQRNLDQLVSVVNSLVSESKNFTSNPYGKSYHSLLWDLTSASKELSNYISENYKLVETEVLPFLNSNKTSIVTHDAFFNDLRVRSGGKITATHWMHDGIGLLVRGQTIIVSRSGNSWGIVKQEN